MGEGLTCSEHSGIALATSEGVRILQFEDDEHTSAARNIRATQRLFQKILGAMRSAWYWTRPHLMSRADSQSMEAQTMVC